MPRILVVEDEEFCGRQLQMLLSEDGHEVRTTASGREAIDLGARFRPDILITDWMLKDDIHGLHVAHVLGAAIEGLHIILMTGFPSEDLIGEVDRALLLDFLQKPFGLDRLREAVARAEQTPAPSRAAALAVVEVDRQGAILWANNRARALFAETMAGPHVAHLSVLFASDCPPPLDQAVGRWLAVKPWSGRPVLWRIRAGQMDDAGSRLAVLLERNEPRYMHVSLIEMLLGIRDQEVAHWPLDGRVLILDGERINRHWLVSLLEGVGAGCYAVGTIEGAVRLIETDDGIRYVVMDAGTTDEDLGARVAQLWSARGDLVIVGSSDADDRARFADAGVDLFLRRPWRADDLIQMLSGRLGNCPECGLEIPLRRPEADEVARSWVCAGCGAHFRAMLDESYPADILSNVRCVDPDRPDRIVITPASPG